MKGGTLLYRQVNPSWMQNGRVTSQAFKPTKKDQGCLSVYDGSQITAEDSWRDYTTRIGYPSAGVIAVTVVECQTEDLQVIPDPMSFPEHVVIDFQNLGRRQVERKAKILHAHAVQRGWQYRPDAQP